MCTGLVSSYVALVSLMMLVLANVDSSGGSVCVVGPLTGSAAVAGVAADLSSAL